MNEAQLRNLTYEERVRMRLPVVVSDRDWELEQAEEYARMEAEALFDELPTYEDGVEDGEERVEHALISILDANPDPEAFVAAVKKHLSVTLTEVTADEDPSQR